MVVRTVRVHVTLSVCVVLFQQACIQAQVITGGSNTDVYLQKQDFTRPGPYPYAVCNQQPGTIGDVDDQMNDINALSATCMPIQAGELAFCTNVAYDACMRVPKPFEYDATVAIAYDHRMAQWLVEFPTLVTLSATAEPPCADALKNYLCYLSFPKCVEDEDTDERYFEQPLCWSMCMNAHMSCTNDAELSTAACTIAMQAGRVAPDRSDVLCHSAASLLRPMIAVSLLFGWLIAVSMGY